MRLLKICVSTFAFLFLLQFAFSQDTWKYGRLKITPNGHYFQFEDGTPFFWLGDTGWELFVQLTKEEIERYLDNRKEKGFNVIQATILANADRPLVPNQYGDLPLIDNNPEKLNERYFELVDWAVQQAMKRNMFFALLPTWGGKVSKFWGKGPEIFNEENAYRYGVLLGERYRDYPNIIWISGGDRPAFTEKNDWRPIWRAMIKGIREGTGGQALVTYHPWGEHASSEYWQNEATLDFNMVQSGHARYDVPMWEWITRDFYATPVKPVLDGEPNYEDHPVAWKENNGYFRAYDVRKQLYRSVFSGGCGVTYGHQAVWQFYSPRVQPIAFPDRFWYEAIDRPGAFQAGCLKELILSRPSLNRIPDQTIIRNGQGEKSEYMTAFRDEDGAYAMVYLPVGKTVEVNTSWTNAKRIVASWFDPRTGKFIEIGKMKREQYLSFDPPTKGVENDWILVLDAPRR